MLIDPFFTVEAVYFRVPIFHILTLTIHTLA